MSTFKELQDLTLSGSFPESYRTLVKSSLNAAYGGLLDGDEWSFTMAQDAVTATAGSNAISGVATDFGIALNLQRNDGVWLRPIEEYREFADLYLGTSNAQSGLPVSYTVLDTTIYVGPTPTATSSAYLLVYEKAVTLLSADADTLIIPAQYQVGLVYAAKAMVHALSDQVLSTGYDRMAQEIFAPMRRRYLRSMRGTATRAPAYRPGGGARFGSGVYSGW